LIKKFDKQSGGALGGVGMPADGNRKSDEWLVLFVAGMWFQDLWTYDFRRTEMCIIPYATQMGELREITLRVAPPRRGAQTECHDKRTNSVSLPS